MNIKETIEDWAERIEVVLGPYTDGKKNSIDVLVDELLCEEIYSHLNSKEDIFDVILSWVIRGGILIFNESINDLADSLLPHFVEEEEIDLLVRKKFKGNSGKILDWKIECDALSDGSIETFAYLINKACENSRTKFSEVSGVPRGGLRIEKALEKYIDPDGDCILIVDDVLTTGGSMIRHMKKIEEKTDKDIYGFVIFDRSEEPNGETVWVDSLFRLGDMEV